MEVSDLEIKTKRTRRQEERALAVRGPVAGRGGLTTTWRKRLKKRAAVANFGAGEKVEEVEGKGSRYDMKQGKGSNRVNVLG
ncbi:hypothetical protein B296_00052941 [Ensete ventricosum]|uniref:Uncharacterized protein n=1 Tax=Ensete ventricosum TaxID=4639 RepID=A0A426WYN8_ENSVE|nr:hypothetical protein B296_00052941 [Ensete ventricosum]